MSKIVLGGDMIELDINEIDSHLTEEYNESAMEEAMADIEEEYESDTVSDYMNYGGELKIIKKRLDLYCNYVVYSYMNKTLKILS